MRCICKPLPVPAWHKLLGPLLAGSVLLLSLATPSASAGPRGAEYFTNAPLLNQDGETLRFYDEVLKGKVVAINFMFTSCGASCPLETAKLRKVQQLLGEHVGKDVFMYSITVDPDRDTPAVLKAYMEKFDVGPGWQFLTGKEEDIKLIRKRLGMFRESEADITEHNVNFIIGNEATGQWMKRTPFDAPEGLVSLMLERLQNYALKTAARNPYTQVRSMPNISKGEDLFRSRCTSCHTIGQGDELGPDLLGVVSKRDRLWLIRWLKEPDVMLQEKDPLATTLYQRYKQVAMPNVKLTDSDIQHLISYIQEESRRVNATALGGAPWAGSLEQIGDDRPKQAARTDARQPAGDKAPQAQARDDATSAYKVQ